MGYSKEDKAASHERILEIASQEFKQRGMQGIGLAELMQKAGLTHGGFYKHFDSREAMVAETVAHAFDEDEVRFASVIAKTRGDPIDVFIDVYLSTKHREHLASSCCMSALGAEIARASDEVRAAFTAQYLRRRAWVAAQLGGSQERASEHAANLMNAMIGSLTVARAINDPALSGEILASSRAHLKTMAKAMQAELSGKRP